MAVSTRRVESDTGGDGVAHVDPRAPRFGQTLTTLGLLAAVLLRSPVLVFAMTLVLVTPVLSGWRIDPYAFVFRSVVRPAVGDPPQGPEPAAPHRFARVLGAVGTTLASLAILAGVPIAGFAVAAAVAAAAGLAAATGICLGCRMYRQVALFRRLSIV